MNRRSLFGIDWHLVAPVLILTFLSLTTLFSLNITLFRNQLIFFLFSTCVFFIFSRMNYKMLQFSAPFIYIGSLICLLLVLVIGLESRGAVRWFNVFDLFQIQFSEILKPFLLISLASFLGNKTRSLKTFFLTLGLLLPIAFLIYRQPDLGNALIYAATVLLTLLFYGFPLLWFFIGFAGVLLTIPITWQFLHAYQKQRILTFLHLVNDPLGISYNAIQSVIATGSGLFFGKGFGQGTQSTLKFLPERHTDFMFATLSEELGFVGSCIVVITFIFLLYRLFVIFQENSDIFCKLFVACTFSLLSIQFFVNIGMNIGLVPVVGVTLPFVSYGGSSFLSSAILLGLVSAMEQQDRRKSIIEIR